MEPATFATADSRMQMQYNHKLYAVALLNIFHKTSERLFRIFAALVRPSCLCGRRVRASEVLPLFLTALSVLLVVDFLIDRVGGEQLIVRADSRARCRRRE